MVPLFIFLYFGSAFQKAEMGGLPSRIKDEEIKKIYRRVSLFEARAKYNIHFQQGNSFQRESLTVNDFNEKPVSLNFETCYMPSPVCGKLALRIQHFEDDLNKVDDYPYVEIGSSDFPDSSPLLLLLRDYIEITSDREGTELTKNYYDSFQIGLSNALLKKRNQKQERQEQESKSEKLKEFWIK